MNKLYLFIFMIAACLVTACKTITPSESAYVKSVEEWRSNRLANLTKADGWTTLVGLYWLKEGDQTLGSDQRNDMVFPSKAPAVLGVMTLTDEGLISADYPSMSGVESDGDLTNIATDISGKPTMMSHESLFWYVIKRGDKYGVRLKDSLNDARFSLTELPHFPVHEKWNVAADFVPAQPGEMINIANAVGQLTPTKVEGRLVFKLGEASLSLVALDGGKEHYFVIFADETTGDTSYGGGRFLDIPRADANNKTNIDFNKAYNPPCVFTAFATCPLPPKENELKIAVNAGEKNVHF